MAVRHRFGGDMASWAFSIGELNDINLQPNATVTFWDAQTGGTQYTDLRASDAVTPVTSVTTGAGNSAGLIPVFYGPSGIAVMWAQSGVGPRALIAANDLGDTGGGGATEVLYALGSRTGAFTVDYANGGVQTVTLTGAITPTIPAPDQIGRDLTLVITQDATGGRTITWPVNVKLAAGALRLSTAAGAVDMVSFRWDGANWRERTRSMQATQDAFTSYVNVRAFGALGNGTANDTAAVQAAVDFAAAIGAAVWLPAGTYLVQPSAATGICVKLTSGVRGIYGAGAAIAGFRVDSGVASYHSIIGNFSKAPFPSLVAAQNITGSVFRDFFIDQNTTNNVVSDTYAMLNSGYPRFCMAVAGGSAANSISIINVAFKDTDGVNTVFFQGRDVTIRDCDMCVSSLGSDHDHSAIYTQNNIGVGGHCNITGNVIYAPAAGNPTARTAIETHGGSQHVTGNTVRLYFKAGNLTGVSPTTGDGIQWVHNSFVGVRYGIDIWSLATASYPPGLRGARISHNTFVLDPVSWTPSGATDSRAIFLDISATDPLKGITALPFQDIWIENNDIRYLSGHVGVSGDTINHAIDLRRTSVSSGIDRNVVIRNNFIDSPIASGIRYTSVPGDYIDGLIISGNRIRNPGQGTAAATPPGALVAGYANGIMIVGALRNSRIEDNDIIDDQASHTMNVGLYLVPSSGMTGGSNNIVNNNRVVGAITAAYQFSPSIDGGYMVRGDVATWTAPTGIVALGSELRSTATGTAYRQTASPGSTWQSYTPGVLPSGTAIPPDIQTFTASGTWGKPTNAKSVMVTLIGGGGGGGSGRRGAASTVRCGGGGGGGGGFTQVTLDASGLPATVAVTVGAAGSGGAAQTVDSTDGVAGVSGGSSIFGAFARAFGGTNGAGGTAISGLGGTGNIGTSVGGNGASASGTGAAGGSAGVAAGPPGGGGGGGISTANAVNAGGSSVASIGAPAGGTGGAGGTVDTTPPTAGGSVTAGTALPGGGGGGGAASATLAAQFGADGGNYGAGGGGGGSSLNGLNSGAGGNGGAGIVQVTTYF